MALNATAHTGFSGWLGLAGDAISGPVWGSLGGLSLRGHLSSLLPSSIVPSVLAVWEARAGVLSLRGATLCHLSGLCQGPQPLPGPQLRNAPSPPNPRSSGHGETFLCPKEEPSGRNQSLRQLEMSEEPQSLPA